jgi:quinol monooxygenase YgiN
MTDSRIRVVARFAVKPESVDAFVEAARRTMVEPTLAEPGCIEYDLCQDAADPTHFVMVETWEDEASLGTHLAQESLQAAIGALMPMAAEPPSIQRLRSVSRGG